MYLPECFGSVKGLAGAEEVLDGKKSLGGFGLESLPDRRKWPLRGLAVLRRVIAHFGLPAPFTRFMGFFRASVQIFLI